MFLGNAPLPGRPPVDLMSEPQRGDNRATRPPQASLGAPFAFTGLSLSQRNS